jgi:multiple sugar transport system ATP-binding protein/alpha-glucoside transport system ATP-binding protein
VAIGRAIVRDPQVFLFDEPLSNLDAALRVETRIEIARLHSRLETTMIYVTHDRVEALTLADKIVVLNGGNIEQVGSPMELYHSPQNVFVAGFIGSPKMNFFQARAEGNKIHFQNGNVVDAPTSIPDGDVTVGLRPEDAQLADEQNALVTGQLELVEKLGEYALAYLTTEKGVSMTAKLDTAPDIKTGETIYLTCDPALLHVFDSASGQRV